MYRVDRKKPKEEKEMESNSQQLFKTIIKLCEVYSVDWMEKNSFSEIVVSALEELDTDILEVLCQRLNKDTFFSEIANTVLQQKLTK